uniref:Calcium-binding protein n=1 Tax=Rhodosorus marinus TaxID=101924 RepID=A0A7S2ZJP1_9RHOD|mmetsp:Transcript_2184/g.8549  ORF Transcript_2184/g.8549 Transcript_2184/m.8549 type:complete len:641 (+) Transcript_2184:174-2096(+)
MVRLLLVLGWALLSLRAVLGQEDTCSDQSFFALPDKVKFIFNSNKWYIGSEARYCVHMVQASQILTDVIDASDKLGFVCFSSVNGCMKMRFKVYPGFRLREVSGTMGTSGKKVGSISHSKKERAGQPAVKSLFFCPETILSRKLCCKTKMFMSPEMLVVEEETGAHLKALPWAKKCKLRSESGIRGPNRPVCDGVRMTCQIANRIYGTEGSDVIHGTEETDVIFGRGGSDEIHGLGGRDYIYGGSGDDMLFGGDNKDTLRGEEGYDILYGENGGDTLLGGYQDDDLFGGKGDDFLNGEEDFDRSFGEVGDDTIVSFNERSGGLPPDAYSSDYISGGDGDDRLFPDFRSSANGGEGNDLMVGGTHKVGGGGNDTMLGGHFNSGGDGDDYIKSFYDDVGYSDRGAVIQGGDGNDDLYIGGAGPQSVSGGEGDDRIRMSSSAQYSNQIIDAGPGDDNVTALSRFSYYDQLTVNLGEGDDNLEAINFFYLDLNGNDGKDYFHVSGTKFYYDIDPSKKVVEIYGDGDDDIVKVFDTKATIFGGDGDDEIVAYYGGTIFGEGGSDDVRGRSDQDHEVLAGEGDDVVTLDGGNNTVAGESGNDVLTTGDGDDNITGGEGNDILESGGGSDTVDGGPGMNIIDGVPDY